MMKKVRKKMHFTHWSAEVWKTITKSVAGDLNQIER